MSLVRWFRKYNTKIMAIVVIFLMIAFIGGSSLRYLLQSDRRTQTVAYYGDKVKITKNDLYIASSELDILKILRADDILRMLQVPLFNSPDLQAFFLGELLFSEQRTPPAYINYIKRTIGTNLYRISEKQFNNIYKRTLPDATIYWYCLKNEARSAGIRVQSEDAGRLLGQIIPRLFNDRTYPQVIGSIVARYGITEQQILETFSNLLSVLRYAHLICSGQDITTRQLMHIVAWEQEEINVEFVEFNSADFTQMQEAPEEKQMIEHFEKYRKYFSGDVSAENPYGFGYKLPERVQLEYIVVGLDDVPPIVKPPSQDEVEEYYDRTKEQLFTEQIPSDPNDPNSLLVERIKPYAAVVNIISKQLMQEKVNLKAESIIQEIITLTELSLEDINDTEFANLSSEELAKKVGDYKTAAEKLSEKYNIKIHTGKTGLLSAIDMQTDEHLSRLYLQGYGQNPVPLTKVVFAVDELAASELGPYDVQEPKMFANIGPVRDMLSFRGGSGEIIALLRVIQAVKATEPESLNTTFSTESLVLDPNDQETNESVFSVKEQVTEDLKKLAALETTESRANEFIDLASNEGWENAIKKYNDTYGKNKEQNPDDSNTPETLDTQNDTQDTFGLENLTGLRRISKATLETIAMQNEGNPASRYYAIEQKRSSLLVDKLYSLVPSDSNSVDNLPLVMEFKPDMSFYCIKDLSIKRLFKEDYDKVKAVRLYTEDKVQSQSLAAIHFNPENILKRMKFRLAKTKETADTDTPTGSEEAS
jgi:hypothetical protein